MTNYPIGEYFCKLDSGGRLMFPADFREQLGELAEGEFVLRSTGGSKFIEIYTEGDWRDVLQELGQKLNRFSREDNAFLRKFLVGVKKTRLDATNRMQIPKDMIQQKDLGKDVVITSLTARMELWNRNDYNETINAISEEEFENKMIEKLGNNSENK
ncbi:MAG: hypothetical protein LBM67_07815 [Lentimicrobiaceae bacterium]|jgi:MraZ protein|nr:hypothetical protein [Lentimicrobiaceae bacterium]